MNAFRSHYDVFGVAKDASPEVIRAAYRVLSQKYHPDHNPDNPTAHHVMAQLNEAYAILSHPAKRHEYDVWLARKELQAQVSPNHLAGQQQSLAGRFPKENTLILTNQDETLTLPTKSHHWIWFVVVAIVIVMGGIWWKMVHLSASDLNLSQQTITAAPNGQQFPLKAAYISGYPVLQEVGGNAINIDGSGLNTAVFAQLFELKGGKFTAIRSFYLPAGEHFNLDKIGDGDFSLHYQRLDNGAWQVSDAIQINNTQKSRQYRDIDIRL